MTTPWSRREAWLYRFFLAVIWAVVLSGLIYTLTDHATIWAIVGSLLFVGCAISYTVKVWDGVKPFGVARTR